MFEQLINNPFLYSLSLTLVHFLWQGLLVGLILKSTLLIIDRSNSKLRYGLATLAMLSNAILAIFTFFMVFPETDSVIHNNLSVMPLTHLVNELTQKNVISNYQEFMPLMVAYALPYLSLLWLATITVLAGKLFIEVRNVNHLPMQASITPNSDLLARFEALAKQINLPKTPRLLISLKAEVPMAIGWLKPVVLLPASMVSGLNSTQLEMLILHELAHIRRHDYLVNFLQTLIELLFFFHPSVHWIGKQMRNEREFCSDDIAVQHCGNALAYAHTLTDTASLCAQKHAHTIPTMAMAASGGDLKARVLRLVDHHCAPSNDTSKWFAAISLLLAVTILCLNQLITMPFTHNLSNSFPWQESPTNSIEDNASPVKSIFISGEDRDSAVTNNSIAKQLLTSQNSINQQLTSKLPIELTPVLNTALTETTLVEPEPVVIANIIENTPAPSAFEEKIATKALVIEQDKNQSEKATTPVLLAVNKEIQVTRDEITQNESSVKPAEVVNNISENQSLELASMTLPQSVQLNNSELIEVETVERQALIAQINDNKTSINKQNDIEQHNDEQLENEPTPEASLFVEPLREKNTAAKLSYSQAIDEFELQNNLYQASNELSDERSFTHDEIQLSGKEHIETTVITHDAKLLSSASPVYPSIAKRRGIELEVKVNFTIDRNGKVKDIDFEDQNKITYFKSAIRTAISKWRFTPATKNNDIIESKMSKIFSFSLQS